MPIMLLFFLAISGLDAAACSGFSVRGGCL